MYFQIDEPVNPTTVDTPSRAAVLAAFLTASSSPLSDTFRVAVAPDGAVQDAAVPLVDGVVADGLALQVRRDGEHLQAVAVEDLPAVGDVVRRRPLLRATSRWSPEQAISSPSYPHSEASLATSSNGRSAHWPVNRVIGRLIEIYSPFSPLVSRPRVSAIWSATRQALAMIVRVGFAPVPVGNGAPSTTNRLSTS